MSNKSELIIRKANLSDHPFLESLRIEAFSPIFASFREALGDEIYELAQKKRVVP